jgi:hypothetical protein
VSSIGAKLKYCYETLRESRVFTRARDKATPPPRRQRSLALQRRCSRVCAEMPRIPRPLATLVLTALQERLLPVEAALA